MIRYAFVAALFAIAAGAGAQSRSGVASEVQSVYASAVSLYQHLHSNPELSARETATAAKMADELKQLGFEVTTGVGGTGVVGVLKNGSGPTVMLRTELDALPVQENTGLPFASKVRVKDASGIDVPVMHACGHDLHMASWVSAAKILAGSRGTWKGTLVMIGQPAEETGAGAKAMVDDGLLTRFPRPDYAISVHDDARRPSGEIGYRAGPVLSNADALTIRIFGRGGHGARPETTIDPVVIAARTVLALQTIVSREMNPFNPTVITVGSIHGGTKNNVIPDEVVLQLTVRSFTTPVREQLLSAIERVVKAEAAAAGATKAPTIERVPTADALVNDSTLTRRVSAALVRALGSSRAVDGNPEMVSEDFSVFQLAGIPTLQMRIGAVEPGKFAAAMKSGETLPSLHSSGFAPDLEPTMKAAIMAEVIALRELMPPGGGNR
jgi:hippurate hydrolase